jgi:hypothetical protein
MAAFKCAIGETMLALLAGYILMPRALAADSSQSVLLTVPLTAARANAGEIGRVLLIPVNDKTTEVVLEVSGVPQMTTRPVHLYTYIHDGTCGRPSPKPVYSLNRRVRADTLPPSPTGSQGLYTVRNRIDVSLTTLRQGPRAIVVKSAPQDGDVVLFCGNIAAG